MQTLILYGIPNCSTVKKARDWLENNGVGYTFHDFKKIGLSQQLLENWLKQVPHEKLINRAGLTWRGLDDTTKALIIDNASNKAINCTSFLIAVVSLISKIKLSCEIL